MFIGADEGCHDVPDAIAPMDIVFFALGPTRMLMSSPFITMSGPIFMFLPPIFMPGIGLVALAAEGLAAGPGICIPGMFTGVCGEMDGVGEAGGIFIFIGAGEGDACGICMPGIPFSIAGEAGVGDAFGEAEGVGERIGILGPVC